MTFAPPPIFPLPTPLQIATLRGMVSRMTASTPFNDLSSPLSYLRTRRSGRPREMVAPGPNAAELRDLCLLALRTPDHGKLAPTRFVIVEDRDAFEALLLRALAAEKPDAPEGEKEAARMSARYAPSLVIALHSPRTDSHIPLWEQELSTGAAVMNLLHGLHASGYVGGWITGWAAFSDEVRDAFGGPDERIAGLIYAGSTGAPLEERPRPGLEDRVSEWP